MCSILARSRAPCGPSGLRLVGLPVRVRAGPSWALRWRRGSWRGQRSAAFRLQQQIIKIVLPDFLPGYVEKCPDSPFIFLVLQQIRKLAIGFFGRVAGI